VTDTMHVLSQAEVEHQIVQVDSALAAETARYAGLAEAAADAEADYKLAQAQGAMTIAARGDPPANRGGPSVAEKDAEVLLGCHREYRSHLLLAARLDATREALRSLRTRLDALRTIAANIRAAGG